MILICTTVYYLIGGGIVAHTIYSDEATRNDFKDAPCEMTFLCTLAAALWPLYLFWLFMGNAR